MALCLGRVKARIARIRSDTILHEAWQRGRGRCRIDAKDRTADLLIDSRRDSGLSAGYKGSMLVIVGEIADKSTVPVGGTSIASCGEDAVMRLILGWRYVYRLRSLFVGFEPRLEVTGWVKIIVEDGVI